MLALCIGSIVLALVALLASARTYALARASVPNQVVLALRGLEERVVAAETNLEGHDRRALEWRTEMDGILEAAETVLDRVERKRRVTAAHASKLKQHEAQGPAPDSDAELHMRARAQGLM